ncbi:hypothetical protein Tco_0738605 [Tanacetum coccineum]
MDIDDTMDYTLAQDIGKGGSSKGTARQQSTVKPDQGIDKENEGIDSIKVSTNKVEEGTASIKLSTNKIEEGTAESDDNEPKETKPKQFQKKREGVELKDVENIERPRPTSTRSILTLKPLLKIDPKDKGKKRIKEEESNTASDDINETEKKKKLAEEEAIKDALIQDFDDIQARIDADRILAERLQEDKREQFTIKERAKFLHDTIAPQRRFLTQQRSEAIKNKPPTRTQLMNQIMTYLKHVGNKKHSDLKNKTFKEIQVLYEKVKRFDECFIAVSSTKDERKIKEMNDKAKDLG